MKAQLVEVPYDWHDTYRISQAFTIGDLVITSGHGAIDDNGQIVGVGDFRAQAIKTLENLRNTLEAAGSGFDKLIKVNIYVKDMPTNFPTVVEMRERFFTRPYPADTVVEIVSLGIPEMLIEIDAIAATS